MTRQRKYVPGSRAAAPSRRQFLKLTAGVGAAGALGFPTIVPSSALGNAGAVAPSERIVMASIGCGGQGTGLMEGFMGNAQVQYVAVCDVDAGHRAQALQKVNTKYGNADCKAFKDFREVLAMKG